MTCDDLFQLSQRQDLHKKNLNEVAGRCVKNGKNTSFLIKVLSIMKLVSLKLP